jgi:RNA polymerase sigma-70 factor (ECF subfamily)
VDLGREPSNEQLEELIHAAARLEREAFGELYRLYAPKIHRFIAFQIRDRVLAEDLTNQVFLRAMEAIERYEHRSIGAFNAWLFRIAKNVVVDNWRASKDTVPLEDVVLPAPDSLDSHFESIARGDELRKALEQLTDDQRTVLTYRFALGMSHSEVAKLMGRNEPAIRALQFRAITTLRGVLTEDLV